MIIEFVGLPGAGKSSLEKAILFKFEQLGWNIMSRNEAVEFLALDCSPLPRDRSHWLRRLSTLLYKISLFMELIAFLGDFLVVRDFLHLHRIRAAMRVVEDFRLHSLSTLPSMSGYILNISEGLGQHMVSLRTWKLLLWPTDVFDFSKSCAQARFSANSIIVFINIPEPVAASRLRSRGVPELWPNTVLIEDVLKNFSSGIHALRQLVEDNEKLVLILLDGETAEKKWQKEASQVIQVISKKWNNNDIGGRRL